LNFPYGGALGSWSKLFLINMINGICFVTVLIYVAICSAYSCGSGFTFSLAGCEANPPEFLSCGNCCGHYVYVAQGYSCCNDGGTVLYCSLPDYSQPQELTSAISNPADMASQVVYASSDTAVLLANEIVSTTLQNSVRKFVKLLASTSAVEYSPQNAALLAFLTIAPGAIAMTAVTPFSVRRVTENSLLVFTSVASADSTYKALLSHRFDIDQASPSKKRQSGGNEPLAFSFLFEGGFLEVICWNDSRPLSHTVYRVWSGLEEVQEVVLNFSFAIRKPDLLRFQLRSQNISLDEQVAVLFDCKYEDGKIFPFMDEKQMEVLY
jgi:hypothetical protein